MIFQSIVLKILHKLNSERTISAVYHLIRGKRSGQTIQDVGIFHLHKFFGILPKLSRKIFDEEINSLIENQYISIVQESNYEVTENGLKKVQEPLPITFDGWHYRGNEHLFFARLSLIVQSLSHQKRGIMKFIPIQQNEEVQQWVKNFLLGNHYQNGTLQDSLLEEMILSLENTTCNETDKLFVMQRLAGYKIPGYTWQQISMLENVSNMDVQLTYISCLHNWLNEITQNNEQYPLLNQIAMNIRIEIPLTGSALQTANLFRKGYSIEQISSIRNLKISTIEDHIVELAMNEPNFSIDEFISATDIELVLKAIHDYNTRKLKILHEVIPHLSYFQLRLVLARGE
ncbi:ATP-dependent DNA helicase RecQ [Lysinibacillus sp. PLM2]|nr:ATP-dependent DNA helicase RecQ [Lysinibacillus sp. PLM2]